jgi:hypothetical protein
MRAAALRTERRARTTPSAAQGAARITDEIGILLSVLGLPFRLDEQRHVDVDDVTAAGVTGRHAHPRRRPAGDLRHPPRGILHTLGEMDPLDEHVRRWRCRGRTRRRRHLRRWPVVVGGGGAVVVGGVAAGSSSVGRSPVSSVGSWSQAVGSSSAGRRSVGSSVAVSRW